MNRSALLRIALVGAAVTAIAVASWATKHHLVSSSLISGATGEVDAHLDQNRNTRVELKVQHMAQPGQLSPPVTAYVVWFQQSDSSPFNEGVLNIGSDRKGAFTTSTPFKNFEIRITAENDPMTKNMKGPVVMRATVRE